MRILFCSLDYAGFLYPTIGLALCARARGHEVAVVTSSTCAEVLARHGLWRISRGQTSDGPSFKVGIWAKPLSVAIEVKHIDRAVELFQPDVLFAQQLTLGPRICAEIHKLPIALLGFCTYLWPAGSQAGVSADRRARLRWRHGDMISLYNQSRALFHLEPLADVVSDGRLLGDRFFVRGVPELDPLNRELPPQVSLVGSCAWDDPLPWSSQTDLAEWIDAARREGRPILYVEPGRVFDRPSFWPALTEGLRDSPFAVAASIGRADRLKGEIPPHWFVCDHVPQHLVLPHAVGVVASATTTVALGAMTAGLPALFIPAGGEQPDVAEVVSDRGAARVLAPEDATAQAVRKECLEVVGDEGMKSAARRLSREFARFDGPNLVIDDVEHLYQEARHGAVPPRYRHEGSATVA